MFPVCITGYSIPEVKYTRLNTWATSIPLWLMNTDESIADDMYARFLKTIGVAGNQIKDFSVLYNSEESKKVLDQAKKSHDANPKGIKPWRARDHPDWLDLD